MIQKLKVEITPIDYLREDKTILRELRIRIDCTGMEPIQKHQVLEYDELKSYFEQVWDCAKKEILELLKENESKKQAQRPHTSLNTGHSKA